MQGLPRANDHLVKMRGLLLSVRVSALAVLTLSFGACSFRGFDSFMDGAAGQLSVTGGSTGDGGTPQNGGTAGSAGTGDSSGGTGGAETGGKGGTGGTGGKAGTGGTGGGTAVKEKAMPAARFSTLAEVTLDWNVAAVSVQEKKDEPAETFSPAGDDAIFDAAQGAGDPVGAAKFDGTGGEFKPGAPISPALDVTNLVLRGRMKAADSASVTLYMKSGAGYWADGMKAGVPVGTEWTVLETDLAKERARVPDCDVTFPADNPCEGYRHESFDEKKVTTFGVKITRSSTLWVDAVWFQPRGYKFDENTPEVLGDWEKNVETAISFKWSDQTESGTGGSLEIETTPPGEGQTEWGEGWILMDLPEDYLDLRQLELKARVKSLAGGSGSKVYLIAVDDGAPSPKWGNTSDKLVLNAWSTISLAIARPDIINTGYNPKRIHRIGIKVAGHVLVDWIDFDLSPVAPPAG
jgi:hypothetical protein